MTIQVTQVTAAGHKEQARKITCLTCKLKGCVGRCRWEPAGSVRPPKVA